MGSSLAENRPEGFRQRLNGRFDGLVRQEDTAGLGVTVAARNGWYLVDPQGELPGEPVDGCAARDHLLVLVAEILREERGVWSTMVYVQNRNDPWIIKVFHPRRAGCGCGGGGGVTPWWVLTRLVPEAVPGWNGAACAVPATREVSWWRKIFRPTGL